MGQEMIKRFFSVSDTENKKPVHPIVIWLIIGAILFLVLGNFRGDEKPSQKQTQGVTWEAETNLYLEKTEERLQKVLERIKGAGAVSVFLYFEDGGEQVLATNRLLKSEEDERENEVSGSIEEESEIIRWDQDGVEVPYKVKQRFPEPSGILVVAEGAGDEKVKNEICEAVRAIFGLPIHRIKITN